MILNAALRRFNSVVIATLSLGLMLSGCAARRAPELQDEPQLSVSARSRSNRLSPGFSTRDINRLSIYSSWSDSGHGSPKTSLVFQRAGRRFINPVITLPEAAVNNFVTSLKEPALPTINMAGWGIDSHWLSTHAESAWFAYTKIRIFSPGTSPCEANKMLFIQKFSDPNFFEANLKRYYDNDWTDDYPEMNIILELKTGAQIEISSTSQKAGMLPWQIKFGEHAIETYNPNISRAIERLLPQHFGEKHRLSIDRFLRDLGGNIYNRLEVEKSWAEACNK